MKLETLRILCEKDNDYKLAQDQQQTTPNITNPIDIFRQHNIKATSEETPTFVQNSGRALILEKNVIKRSKSTSDLSRTKKF